MRTGINSILLVMVLAVCLLPSCQSGSSSLPTVTGNKTGELAPDFNLSDINGNRVKLSDFAGRPVMINFWSAE
jgi:cytochrome oxidase Cu insertion factor (SCO1/SenC/PrrC family)